jgi:hypothetical protein
MPGPLPKPSALRTRRHKVIGQEKLGAPNKPDGIPPCPQPCHHRTEQWWDAIWHSPMAKVWADTDVFVLERLALLWDLVHLGEANSAMLGEMRQIEDRYGLSPAALRKLQWEVEQNGGKLDDPEKPASAAKSQEARWLSAVE